MDYEEIQAEIDRGLKADAVSKKTDTDAMTLRERWQRTMKGQPVDRIPNFEFGYWARTLEVWREQGLPPEITGEKKAYEYFGIENWRTAPIDVMGFRPGFGVQILEDDGHYQTFIDDNGATLRINLQGDRSIPQHLDFGLKDRKSWERYKERLQPDVARVPDNWPELAAAFRDRDFPLAVPIGSMIGRPRNWIGFEGIALMIYDDPELLEEIVETVCNLVCTTLARVMSDVTFDFGVGWEDICFNSGPIVSVDFMRNVVVPRYQRITNLLTQHGCEVAWTDTDGNILPIIDCFLEGGINCMFPVEVHAGSDPVEMRRRWPGLRMQGGVDKMALDRELADIAREIERLKPLVEEGRFIPSVDHRVPANIPLRNYKTYLKLKRDILGVGGEPQYDESAV